MGLSQTRTTWNQYACPYFLHCPQSMSESDVWLLRASLSGRRPPARSFSVFLVIRRNREILSLIFSISPSRARSLSSVESSPRLFLEPPLFLAPFCLFGLAELEFDIGFFSSFLSGAPGRFFGAAFPMGWNSSCRTCCSACWRAMSISTTTSSSWDSRLARPGTEEVRPLTRCITWRRWNWLCWAIYLVRKSAALMNRREVWQLCFALPAEPASHSGKDPCGAVSVQSSCTLFFCSAPDCPPSTTLSHNFVTHNSFTHNFVTHNSFPHNIVTCNSLHANTQLFPPQHCYTYTYTYSYADTYTYTYTHKQTNKQRNKQTNKQRNKQTHTHAYAHAGAGATLSLTALSHMTLPGATPQPCHTQLFQTQLFHTQLCYTTLLWQAWHLRHWAGSGGALMTLRCFALHGRREGTFPRTPSRTTRRRTMITRVGSSNLPRHCQLLHLCFALLSNHHRAAKSASRRLAISVLSCTCFKETWVP